MNFIEHLKQKKLTYSDFARLYYKDQIEIIEEYSNIHLRVEHAKFVGLYNKESHDALVKKLDEIERRI